MQALRRKRHWTTALSVILWFIAANTPDFIPPTLWPPNSPDLNMAGYKVWSVMQEQVYQTPVQDVNDPKQRLSDVWAALESEDYRLFRKLKFLRIKFKHS